MVKPNKKGFFILYIFKFIIKGIFRIFYIILAAAMIGFANAYYDENKWVNDLRSHTQQEQVFDDEEEK
jgi:hypothetical protein